MVLRAVRGLSDLLERCATAGEETKKSVGRKPTKREFVSPPPPAPPHCTTGIGESTAMKTVGLLSGGKDSVFNLLHCIVNHHEPIALASLGPGEGKGQPEHSSYLHRDPDCANRRDRLVHVSNCRSFRPPRYRSRPPAPAFHPHDQWDSTQPLWRVRIARGVHQSKSRPERERQRDCSRRDGGSL